MQSVATGQAAAPARRRTRVSSDLVSLAAPVLELVLKLQAGLIQPSNELRTTVAASLAALEQRASTLRYNERQVNAVKFALAAFVDETMMSANFPLRDEWEKYPLQLEYFGEHLAGMTFFEKLDEARKNIESEADVVEVYYLCLLLGFKGKYKIYMEDQLQGVVDQIAADLRRVGRLQEAELSPHWKVRDQPEPPSDPGLPLWIKLGAGALLAIVIFIYIVLMFVLRSDVNAAKEQLLR